MVHTRAANVLRYAAPLNLRYHLGLRESTLFTGTHRLLVGIPACYKRNGRTNRPSFVGFSVLCRSVVIFSPGFILQMEVTDTFVQMHASARITLIR